MITYEHPDNDRNNEFSKMNFQRTVPEIPVTRVRVSSVS